MKQVLILLFALFNLNLLSQPGIDQQAVLDLTDWQPLKKPILTLDGKWELYWNKLLGPSDFSNASLKPDLITSSGSWSDLKINGLPAGNTGCATYRMFLKNIPATALTIDVNSVQTSCRIFLNDSLVMEVGKPGATKETTQPMNRDVLLNIPGHLRNAQLIVQVANFHHRKGGFVHFFDLGTTQLVTRKHTLHYMLEVIESSSLFIIGLFLFALYIFRRKDLSILYFSLFCITLAFRPIIAVNYLLSTLFYNINWNILLKMEYLAVILPCLFMLLFIKKLFTEQLPSWIVKSISAVLILKAVITVVTPPAVFSWLIPPLLFIIVVGVTVFAVTIIRAVMAKVEGSTYAGLGLGILLCSLILKVLVYTSVIQPMHALITGLDIGFIFMMSMILGARFSLQFVKVERLQQLTELQRSEIEHKKAVLEEKNKSIIDSINYARRIQYSLLPPEKYIDKELERLRKERD